MSGSAVPAPLRCACFPCRYKMKRVDTQSTMLPNRAGALSARILAPKLKAAGELGARRFAQSMPPPSVGEILAVCILTPKPSSIIAALRRGTACISHHHHSLLLPPSQAGASVPEASVAGQPQARAWHCHHHGPAHPGHPARDGLATVSNWGGKNKADEGGNKKIISFQPQRAKRESWGGESERRRARCSPAVTPGEQSESEQPY